MVYFICGHRGCGKSYLINQICKERICHVFDTGPILRNSFKNLNLDVSFSDWIKINEEKEGRNFTNKIICQSINLIMVGFWIKIKIKLLFIYLY